MRKLTTFPFSYILLLNLLLKLLCFWYISPWKPDVESQQIVVSDSRGYEDLAENLLKYHSLAPPVHQVNLSAIPDNKIIALLYENADSLRMPGYSIFLALIYLITGIKPYMGILAQIILSVISILLTYRICILLFNNKQMAFIAGLLYALDIQSIYSANLLLSDTLFVFLFTVSVYYFIKGLQDRKIRDYFISSIFIGLSLLVRPVGLLYPAIFIAMLLIFVAQQWNLKLKTASIYIIIPLLFACAWMFRNYNQYGHWQLTTQEGANLLMNASYVESNLTGRNIDSIRVTFQHQADSLGFRKNTNPFEQAEISKKVAYQYISKHKAPYLRTEFQGCINIFTTIGNIGMAKTFGWTENNAEITFTKYNSQKLHQNFNLKSKKQIILGVLILLIMVLQYAGFLYGFIKLTQLRNYIIITFFLLTIIYFSTVTGVIGMYRFKLPMMPIICIAAGYGYCFLLNRKTTGTDNETAKL